MRWDPFTLVVVLDSHGNADGTLYLDDGETFDYEAGAYIHRWFSFSRDGLELVSKDLSTKGKKTSDFLQTMKNVGVEKIILVGFPGEWSDKKVVKVQEQRGKESTAEMVVHQAEGGKARWAVVKKPQVTIGSDWKIDFS